MSPPSACIAGRTRSITASTLRRSIATSCISPHPHPLAQEHHPATRIGPRLGCDSTILRFSTVDSKRRKKAGGAPKNPAHESGKTRSLEHELERELEGSRAARAK